MVCKHDLMGISESAKDEGPSALQVTSKMGLLAPIGLFGIGAKSPQNAISPSYLKPPREQGP